MYETTRQRIVRQQRQAAAMGFDIPIVDDVTGAVADVVSSVWDRIPGSGWVDGVTGDCSDAIGELAKTGVGETVLRAISIALQGMSYAVPYVGGVLALCTVAIPGVVKGDSFDKAFIDEASYRIEKTAEYFAGKAGEEAGKKFSEYGGEQLKTAMDGLKEKAKEAFPDIPIEEAVKQLNITPQALADALGIRPDMAAYVITYVKGLGEDAIRDIKNHYDIETGRAYTNLGRKLNLTPAQEARIKAESEARLKNDPCGIYQDAVRRKMPPAILANLKAKCDAWKVQQMLRSNIKTNFTLNATPLSASSLVRPPIKALGKAKVAAATRVSDEDQQQLIEYARRGFEESKTVPSIAAARALDSDPMYLFGFDVAIGLCKGMWLPGPGQDRVKAMLDGSRIFRLPNGQEGKGNAAAVKGFNVGQSLQHGITKAVNDTVTQNAAAAGPNQAAGAYVAAGLAGSGLPADQKAETAQALVGNAGAVAGAAQVATKKVGYFRRFLTWLGL